VRSPVFPASPSGAALIGAALMGAALMTGLPGCAGNGNAEPGPAPHYLRYVWIEVPVNEKVHLRWPKRAMPLKVHLPRPPDGMVGDPDAVLDAVRDGVLDWTDVAAPGIPSFAFVDAPGQADIPIIWEATPSGDWYVAHCAYDIHPLQRRFGVSRILVTGRWRGQEPSLDTFYAVVLHEMGHALGLTGHSPDRRDTLYPQVNAVGRPQITDRDRETLRLLYERPIGHRVSGARRAD
jgi:hypothetical protein